MVYMHIPNHLTEEEEMLQKKYAKLRKKKKALAALRAPKTEPKPEAQESRKRPAEAAADATEQAKKLLKSGAIRVEIDKKDQQTFKRTKRQKETCEKTAVGFQPFSPTHTSDGEAEPRDKELDRQGGRGPIKGLYESFVGGAHPGPPDREPASRDREYRPYEQRERREREPPPKKGRTVYVFGRGLTEEVLKQAFVGIGSIVNLTMEREKSVGFVTFDTMDAADQAIAEKNNTVVGTVQIRVSMARRQPQFDHQPSSSVTPGGSAEMWGTLSANMSQKGNSSHKDMRESVVYDQGDMFDE